MKKSVLLLTAVFLISTHFTLNAQGNLDVDGDGAISNNLGIGLLAPQDRIHILGEGVANFPGLTLHHSYEQSGNQIESFGRIWQSKGAMNIGYGTTGTDARISIFSDAITFEAPDLGLPPSIYTKWGFKFYHKEPGFSTPYEEQTWLKKAWNGTDGDYLYLGSTGNRNIGLQSALVLSESGFQIGQPLDSIGTGINNKWFSINHIGETFISPDDACTANGDQAVQVVVDRSWGGCLVVKPDDDEEKNKSATCNSCDLDIISMYPHAPSGGDFNSELGKSTDRWNNAYLGSINANFLTLNGSMATPWAFGISHLDYTFSGNVSHLWLDKGWTGATGDYLYLGGSGNRDNDQQGAILMGETSGILFGKGHNNGDQLSSEHMRINTIGNVGIGTSSPAQKLHVNGLVQASCGVLSCSDARYKKNLSALESPLPKIIALQPTYFYWKTEEYAQNNFPEGKQIGIIAQNLEQQFPELVYTDEEGYKTVDYAKLTAVLVAGMKEQQGMIEALQYKTTQMENLAAELEKLKSELSHIAVRSTEKLGE